MSLKNTAVAIVILSAATVWGQGPAPMRGPAGRAFTPVKRSASAWTTPSDAGSKPAETPGTIAMRERLQDLQDTVSKMQALLHQMNAKAAAKKPEDPLVKANVEMWQLMLGHLGKQVEELRTAMATREDLEARRAAMYKQAEVKSAAAAQAARDGGASPAAVSGAAGQSPADAASGASQPQTNSAPATSSPK